MGESNQFVSGTGGMRCSARVQSSEVIGRKTRSRGSFGGDWYAWGCFLGGEGGSWVVGTSDDCSDDESFALGCSDSEGGGMGGWVAKPRMNWHCAFIRIQVV